MDRTRNHLRLDVVTLMGEWEGTPRHPGAAALLRLARDGVFDLESGGERRALEELLSRCEVLPDSQVQDPQGNAAFIDRVRRQRERLIQTGAIGRPALPAQPDRRVPLRTLLPAA